MRNRLISLTAALLAMCWCAAAYAATGTFGSELSKIPPGSYFLVVLLAGIPGLYSLLEKYSKGLIPEGAKGHVMAAKELLGSIIAGFGSFFLCEGARASGWAIPEPYQVAAIAVCGYLGSRVIDLWARRAEQRIAAGEAPGA